MYLAHSFPPLHTVLVNYPAPIRRGRENYTFSVSQVISKGRNMFENHKVTVMQKCPPKLTGVLDYGSTGRAP